MPRNKIVMAFSILAPLLVIATLMAIGRHTAGERTPAAVTAPAPTHAPLPPQLPAMLGGLPLTGFTQETAAQVAIRQLHRGPEFLLDAVWTGDYGDAAGGRAASVWGAESAKARELLARMRDGLADGRTPFTPPRKISCGGVEVYVTRTGDEMNYFWTQGSVLLWLSAPGFTDAAGQALVQELGAFTAARQAPRQLPGSAR